MHNGGGVGAWCTQGVVMRIKPMRYVVGGEECRIRDVCGVGIAGARARPPDTKCIGGMVVKQNAPGGMVRRGRMNRRCGVVGGWAGDVGAWCTGAQVWCTKNGLVWLVCW